MSLTKKQNEEYIRRSGMRSTLTAEHYREEIGILFKEWKAKADTQGTPFVTDGVMDPEKWFHQATRPLFLLKEAYGEESDWDLATDHVLLDRPITKDYKMWKRVSLWSAGMLSSDYKLPHRYNPGDAEYTEFGNNHLHQIAVVNIKKYCGKKPLITAKSNNLQLRISAFSRVKSNYAILPLSFADIQGMLFFRFLILERDKAGMMNIIIILK